MQACSLAGRQTRRARVHACHIPCTCIVACTPTPLRAHTQRNHNPRRDAHRGRACARNGLFLSARAFGCVRRVLGRAYMRALVRARMRVRRRAHLTSYSMRFCACVCECVCARASLCLRLHADACICFRMRLSHAPRSSMFVCVVSAARMSVRASMRLYTHMSAPVCARLCTPGGCARVCMCMQRTLARVMPPCGAAEICRYTAAPMHRCVYGIIRPPTRATHTCMLQSYMHSAFGIHIYIHA
jgi:hypothetical protein